MIELRLSSSGMNRAQVKELQEWINTTRAGRYGTIDMLWQNTELLLRFYEHDDVLAFKLKFDYEKMQAKYRAGFTLW